MFSKCVNLLFCCFVTVYHMKLPLSRSMEKTYGQAKEIVKEDTGSIEGKVRLKKSLFLLTGQTIQ
jgi:hypothetical protein